MGVASSRIKKEKERLRIVELVKKGELNKTEASKILGLSYRQTLRIVKRYLEEGIGGLIHKGRGKKRKAPKVIDRD